MRIRMLRSRPIRCLPSIVLHVASSRLQIPADHIADDLIQEVLLFRRRQVAERLRELIERRAGEVPGDGPAVVHAAVSLHQAENPADVFRRSARPGLAEERAQSPRIRRGPHA